MKSITSYNNLKTYVNRFNRNKKEWRPLHISNSKDIILEVIDTTKNIVINSIYIGSDDWKLNFSTVFPRHINPQLMYIRLRKANPSERILYGIN